MEKSDEADDFNLCDEINIRNLGYRLKVGTDYQSVGETGINSIKKVRKRTLGGLYKHIKKISDEMFDKKLDKHKIVV